MKARFKSNKKLSFYQEHLTKLNIFVPLVPALTMLQPVSSHCIETLNEKKYFKINLNNYTIR